MKITSSNLMRLAGLCAVPAGIIFAAIQPIHPPDVVESVTTAAWAIITPLKTAMCLLFLVGITRKVWRLARVISCETLLMQLTRPFYGLFEFVGRLTHSCV